MQMCARELTPTEIIMGDHTCQNGEGERVLEALSSRMDENSLMIRKYNSLFFLSRLAVGEAEAHFYSVDSAIYAFKALKYFIEQSKDAGVKVIYVCDFSDPNMKRMVEMIKLTVQPSDKQDFKYMVSLGRSM